MRKHPIPDPEAIKKNLTANADVSYTSALDNGASMPVAVHYRPKSVSGEKMLSSMTNSVSTIQTSERCLKRKQSERHIVTRETSDCVSLCEDCFTLESVCSACQENGQVSHIPSLRAYNNCLKDGVTCNKVVVMAIVTDCEECNKQALLELDSLAETSVLPPELVLAVPFPDVVYLGKSVKCSWSSWFIELDGEMSVLVLLRILCVTAMI